jgi:hypothetical protein
MVFPSSVICPLNSRLGRRLGPPFQATNPGKERYRDRLVVDGLLLATNRRVRVDPPRIRFLLDPLAVQFGCGRRSWVQEP